MKRFQGVFLKIYVLLILGVLAHSKDFSWERAARETLAVYRTALHRQSKSAREGRRADLPNLNSVRASHE